MFDSSNPWLYIYVLTAAFIAYVIYFIYTSKSRSVNQNKLAKKKAASKILLYLLIVVNVIVWFPLILYYIGTAMLALKGMQPDAGAGMLVGLYSLSMIPVICILNIICLLRVLLYHKLNRFEFICAIGALTISAIPLVIPLFYKLFPPF